MLHVDLEAARHFRREILRFAEAFLHVGFGEVDKRDDLDFVSSGQHVLNGGSATTAAADDAGPKPRISCATLQFRLDYLESGSLGSCRSKERPFAKDGYSSSKPRRRIIHQPRLDWSAVERKLVRINGVEPSHPFGYMNLNHARLPIPPYPHNTITRPIAG